jgi:lysozyme
MAGINGSVGQGGDNNAADVSAVQQWLNARLGAALQVDGICGPQTIAAIKSFQATVRGVITPDGLISPGGPTLQALLPSITAVGPSFPQGAVRIVDLSHNNAGVAPGAFAALKAAGVGAVILKASQGASFKDPLFTTRIAQARQAGLLVGAYHFGTGEDPAVQLANYTAAIAAARVTFAEVLAALDLEPNFTDHKNPPGPPETMSLSQGDIWIAAFKAQTNATPLIYGGANYLGAGGQTHANLTASPLWIAAYPNSPTVPAALPGWADWTFWQYTDGTRGAYAAPIAGLSCDQSVFRGSLTDLTTAWSGWLAAAPPASPSA